MHDGNTKNPKFSCNICHFITNNKKDFSRHEMTLKHRNGVIGPIWTQKKPLTCSVCNKSYTSRSGLYKHSKICEVEKTKNISGNNIIITEKLQKNANVNKNDIHQEKIEDMYKLLLKYCKSIDELQPVPGNTTNNITNNITNTINVHVYLNEQCKDAINLPEFIKNIQLQLSDLSLANKDGLLHSTKNIFLKELQNTEPVKRPIQCTDIKRKTLYIKEDGNWCKDVGNKKVKGAIHNLSQKHIPLVKDWQKMEGKEVENQLEYVQVVKSTSKNILEEERGVQSALREICKETYMKGEYNE